MNKNVKSVFQSLLIDAGLNQPAPLGGGTPKLLSTAQRELLLVSLADAAKWNGILASILIVAQAGLLIFCLVIAWYLKDNPESFKPILGGSLLGLGTLITGFAVVWKEKHRMDILRAVLPFVPLDKLTELAFAFASGDLKSLNL